MKNRRYYRKSQGQSIPLLALILVILFGMAALALDVGNTYAEQREVVRATNAAAIEAMDATINNAGVSNSGKATGLSDGTVLERIYDSLKSNGIPVAQNSNDPSLMKVEAYYFDAAGHSICQVGSCGTLLDQKRGEVSYVRVAVEGKVPTYFARLVGRPDLPVNAVAHASTSICTSGIYPIMINKDRIDEQKKTWVDVQSRYTDDIYRNLPVTRIWQKESGVSGNFGYVLWPGGTNSAGNAPWLRAALTPPGNADSKELPYNEAPWPDKNATQLVEPNGYPLKPGIMNKGDWVAANSGNSNTVSTELQYLISKRIILTLPLYDDAVGNGANGAFHLYGVGKFLLLGHGHQGGNPGGWYMDLAYIGQGDQCVELTTPPYTPTEKMTLEGEVSIFPHFKNEPQTSRAPLQMLIVLDSSGSMGYNFEGYAYKGSQKLKCQGSDSVDCGGQNVRWNVASERRINIAVKILKEMILTKLDPTKDQVRIITYSNSYGEYGVNRVPPADQVLDGLTTVVPGTWTSDAAVLSAALDNATDENLVQGETPSGTALARALQVYNSSDPNIPGTNTPKKRAVILLTDGYANVTNTGMWYPCPTTDANSRPYDPDSISCLSSNPTSPKLDSQTDYPINAMNKEGNALNALIKGEENGNGLISAVAMGPTSGGIGETLLRIATTKSVAVANNETELREKLDAIFDSVISQPCSDGVLYKKTTIIESSSLPSGTAEYDQIFSQGIVGYIKLSSPTTTIDNIPIKWDASTKRLTYRAEEIPPGEYSMSYWVAYRGPDGVVLVYRAATTYNNPDTKATLTQNVSLLPGTNLGATVFNIIMDLEDNIDVCARVKP